MNKTYSISSQKIYPYTSNTYKIKYKNKVYYPEHNKHNKHNKHTKQKYRIKYEDNKYNFLDEDNRATYPSSKIIVFITNIFKKTKDIFKNIKKNK
jgi:hypothetical protein